MALVPLLYKEGLGEVLKKSAETTPARVVLRKNIKSVMENDKTKHSRSAGGVVVGPDKKIVVVNQKHKSWSLPKGHIDLGEDALSAAKREIWEETGIPQETLKLEKDLESYERYKISLDGGDDKSEFKTITMFLFTTNHAELAPVDLENPEAVWLSAEEAVEKLTHYKDKEFLRSVIAELK